MDKKMIPSYIMSTRDPPQNKGPTQTESEGLEENFPRKWTGNKNWGCNTYMRQNGFQNKGHKNRHPHCHSRTWVCQQRRMGPALKTGIEAQVPPAEGNNPSVPHNVLFRRVPTTWGNTKDLSARAKILSNKKCSRSSTIIYNG